MDEMWWSMHEEAEQAYSEMVIEKGLLNVPDEELMEDDLKVKRFMLENGIEDDSIACLMVNDGLTKEQAEEAIREEEEMAWENGTWKFAEA